MDWSFFGGHFPLDPALHRASEPYQSSPCTRTIEPTLPGSGKLPTSRPPQRFAAVKIAAQTFPDDPKVSRGRYCCDSRQETIDGFVVCDPGTRPRATL